MDAKARRLLWNDISSLTKENRIVILTSHNMEECEILCTRIVIMINGKFKCLGSPQHLKTKFGKNYKISLRFVNEYSQSNLLSFIRVYFSHNYIVSNSRSHNKRLFEFSVPFKDTKLSIIFKIIEQNRTNLNIYDYSIIQTTLDEVFVNFASEYNDEIVRISVD